MLRAGAQLPVIASVLGHVSSDSTNVYMEADEDSMARAAAAAEGVRMKTSYDYESAFRDGHQKFIEFKASMGVASNSTLVAPVRLRPLVRRQRCDRVR
jgi:hypothetical protein